MRLSSSRARPRALAISAITAVALVAAVVPASAHSPVELSSHDVLPWQGPVILNGQSPVMLFGTLDHPFDERAAQLHMTAGQEVVVDLAIPNEAPENTLATDQLPVVYLIAPDHKVIDITAQLRVPIATETGLKMLLLQAYAAAAESGNYSLVVVGLTPSRFALATGVEGTAFAGVERGSVATLDEVNQWYATPPATDSGPWWRAWNASPLQPQL